MDEAEILRQLKHHIKLWHKGGHINLGLSKKLNNLLFYKDWDVAGIRNQSSRQRAWMIKTVGKCQQVGCVLAITASNPLTQDHVHPSSKGGKDGLHNKQLLCKIHNTKKGDRII